MSHDQRFWIILVITNEVCDWVLNEVILKICTTYCGIMVIYMWSSNFLILYVSVSLSEFQILGRTILTYQVRYLDHKNYLKIIGLDPKFHSTIKSSSGARGCSITTDMFLELVEESTASGMETLYPTPFLWKLYVVCKFDIFFNKLGFTFLFFVLIIFRMHTSI